MRNRESRSLRPKLKREKLNKAIAAVKAAFETWDVQASIELFNDYPQAISRVSGKRFDGKNVVSWGRLRVRVVAVTYIWYWSDTLEIVEFGMVFNNLYAWGIDPDGEGGVTINASMCRMWQPMRLDIPYR